MDDAVFEKIREEVALWKEREIQRMEKQSGATASTRSRTAYTPSLRVAAAPPRGNGHASGASSSPSSSTASPTTSAPSRGATRTALAETELPWLPEMAETFAQSAQHLAACAGCHAADEHASEMLVLGWPEGAARRQVLLDTQAALQSGHQVAWRADAAAQGSPMFSRILEEAADLGACIRLDPSAGNADRALLRTVLMLVSEPEAGCRVWPVCEGTVAMLAQKILGQREPPPHDWPADKRAWTRWVEAVADAWERVWPGYVEAAWLSVLTHAREHALTQAQHPRHAPASP